MYTQCPECQIAFRVTVKVLQKAGGRVRCGGCGIAFSAIEYLSEELPAASGEQSEAVVDAELTSGGKDEVDDGNKALLKTLEELAGPEDVRIEDTGIEWRVLDNDEETGDADEPAGRNETGPRYADDNQASLDLLQDNSETDAAPDIEPELQHAAVSSKRRYDDNSPLPDNFEDQSELLAPRLTETEPPRVQAAEQDANKTDRDTHQVEMALANDDDWTGLLDDYQNASTGDDENAAKADPEPGTPEEYADSETPDANVSADIDEYAVDEDELSPEEEADIVKKLRDSTGSFQKQIEAAQRALERDDIEVYEDTKPDPETQDIEESEASASASDVGEIEYVGLLPQADEDETFDAESDADTIDVQIASTLQNQDSLDKTSSRDAPVDQARKEADILSQTMLQAGIDPSQMDIENIETIVMEGNFVFDSLDNDTNVESDLGKRASLIDTYMLNKQQMRGGRRKSDPPGFGVIAGVVVLVVILLAQYIHASRETFATYGAFNQTLGPVYRALGKPLTPQWNIKGWQFESTNGSTDENEAVLTVISSIRNTSDKPLPYPLVHVSLTDRWAEIIGSKVLGPSEYLAGDLDPRQAVPPGEAFTAVIAIKEPSPEATGFQLYACYRTSPGQMRCATEDFKN